MFNNRVWFCLLKAIIRSILVSGRLGPNIKHVGCYGLLLKHLKSDELHWLHPDLTVEEVEQRYESHHVEAEWRYRSSRMTRVKGQKQTSELASVRFLSCSPGDIFFPKSTFCNEYNEVSTH